MAIVEPLVTSVAGALFAPAGVIVVGAPRLTDEEFD
jgi:hypothetical protein